MDRIPGMWLAGLHFETNVSGPLLKLFHAGAGPLLAVRVHAIGRSVLGLVWLDGCMDDVGSELDLEVKGIV